MSVTSRIPRRLLRLRDQALDADERVIWQGRPDAWADLKMLLVTWWLGVPWVAVAVLATYKGWIDDSAFAFIMIGLLIMALPFIHFARDLQTLFVITNQRALILRAAWKDSKTTVASTCFEAMDKELEILPVRGHVGHLNFASGVCTQDEDADHTGRYGFRCVKNVEKVRDLLATAIAKYA